MKQTLILITLLISQSVFSKTLHDFSMPLIKGENKSLADYKGKKVLVVNIATKCGLTPQLDDLEAFAKNHKNKNVVVLGFPSNNFMGQTPEGNDKVAEFCRLKYGVTFPLFKKINVKGENINPLYSFILDQRKSEKLGDIRWNFEKVLFDENGKYVKSFSPQTLPNDEKFLTYFK